MASSDMFELTAPSPSHWADLGLSPVRELHAGHQSKVFVASGPAGRVVVKFIEASDNDGLIRTRVELTRRLTELNPAVVGPIDMGFGLVAEIDPWQVICYPFVAGTEPNPSDQDEVEAMAVTLAALHRSLATLTEFDLPPVRALQAAPEHALHHGQIIHGDYASANLIVTPDGIRVIDFADCGRGTVELEIGNSLYMVLFDAWHNNNSEIYHRFRSGFIDSYQMVASHELDHTAVDDAIEMRTEALRGWLADPNQAPAGIRAASPEWRERLEVFVGSTNWQIRGSSA